MITLTHGMRGSGTVALSEPVILLQEILGKRVLKQR